MMMKHVEDDVLRRYYAGELGDHEIGECEKHLVECDTCRRELAFLTHLLDENILADEAAILDAAEARLPTRVPLLRQPLPELQRSWWSRRVWQFAVAAASLVLAAGAIWMMVPGQTPPRSLEARLSDQPYSEFIHTRAGETAQVKREAGADPSRLGNDRHRIGNFYLQHNDPPDAVVQLESAEQAAPNSPEIANDLGVAYMESAGDTALDRAVREFERSLELNPRFEPARFNLALAYEREGKFSEAEQQLQTYLQLDSSSNWAKEVRSKLQLLNR